MGLQDILTGMMNGPHGEPQPTGGTSASASAGGGMSPLTMALLGLLAYKAVKGLTGGGAADPGGAGRPGSLPPGGTTQAGNPGGGLGDILGGLLGGGPAGTKPGGTMQAGNPGGGGLGDILGGLFGGGPGGARPGSQGGAVPGGLGGAAAGTVLSGGLDRLIKDLQGSGQGRAAQSWVGKGPNEDIPPRSLEAAIGSDTVDALARQTGMRRDELLATLSRSLPGFIDQLTPDGRLPTREEASRLI